MLQQISLLQPFTEALPTFPASPRQRARTGTGYFGRLIDARERNDDPTPSDAQRSRADRIFPITPPTGNFTRFLTGAYMSGTVTVTVPSVLFPEESVHSTVSV